MPVSFKKNLTFTAKPEIRLDAFTFDGGLVVDVHETKLEPNQSPNMANVIFDDSHSIKTRNGYIKYNASSIGATPITGLMRFYGSGGVQQTLAKYGTTLYRGNDVAGTFASITLGSGVSLVSDSYTDSTIVNGTLLVVDGLNYIQKYRGSTNTNYATGTLSVTINSPVVTGSGTTWGTATNAVAGQYIQLPDGKWYQIVSIASNTQLVIECDYKAATASGQAYKIAAWGEVQGKLDSASAPSLLVRPAPSYIENYANRIWTLEGNTLRFSALDTSVSGEHFNDFDSANNAGAINLPSSKETAGTGIYAFNEALYIFQRQAIWRLSGNAPANFELKNLSSEVGLTSRRSLVEWNNLLIFLSNQGVVVFDGTNIRNISRKKINTLIESWSDKTSPAGVLWDNKYLLTYTPGGDSANTEAVFCDLAQGDIGSGVGLSVGSRWGRFTNIPANVFSSWNGGTDNGQIYFGSSAAGFVYLWDSGTTDSGTDIDWLYDTPSIGYEKNVDDKNLKKFYLQQVRTGDWNMTARLYTDINVGPTSSDINLAPGTSSLWGTMVWGDNWSSEGDLITSQVGEFQGLAKYFKFRFEGSDPAEVLGLTSKVRTRRI